MIIWRSQISKFSCDDYPVAYVAVYGENVAAVGDGGKDIEGLSV